MSGPGLQGTHEGSCVVCLKGTDTAVILVGEAEPVAAAYVHLGIPKCEAARIVSTATGCSPGMVPAGEIKVRTRLCRQCAGPFPVGLDAGDTLPIVRPPAE
jgi:hypothetical protein